jgi:hypothetical protein
MSSQWRQFALLALALVALTLVQACGNGSYGCFFASVTVSGSSDAADHSSLSPGNSVRFAAFGSGLTAGCFAAQSNLMNVVWSVSDPKNVSISNAKDQTYGVATCLGATSGAVTVTATLMADTNSGVDSSGSSTMVCK